ncbi:type IV secretory system conjugative DNA transfer family protein [Zavarzinella formosa]|uniref:type IV secretory system conjugative DNA transfer family protein n=1 Tax=Zavarzinella formosa TaxID=360055 RepID=UPI000311E64D|nr:type IV secretory system conjugative DNA transfer family protein [Zavarzinella formosa]
MHRLMRITLIFTVLLTAYVAVLLIVLIPNLWWLAVVATIAVSCQKTRRYSAHGTARWAGISDLPSAMFEGNGLIIGHLNGRLSKTDGVRALFNRRLADRKACQKFLTACQPKQSKPLVRLSWAVHSAIFAPTGAGKGVSCIVPWLLSCRESAVVVDFKAENVRLTANARRKMGHRVVILDPYKIATPEPDTFNPLEFFDPGSDTAIDDCRDLAEALVLRTGKEHDPHWCDGAEIWISAMIAAVICFASKNKSLQSVRAVLTDPDKMREAIDKMCESGDVWEGMLSRFGHQLRQFRDKELGSVLTTTNRFLRFLDSVAISDSTRQSSFNPAELLNGRMTVYLVLPPEHMRAQSALLRLWLGSMLRAVVKGGLQETNKVHFLIDEASSVGSLDSLNDALDKFRGYGVRLQLYYQSLGQLKKCWPDGADQTLLSNVTQVFFGVNDQQTAEYVSSRLGETTILVSSGGTSSGVSSQTSPQGTSHGHSSNTSDQWQQLGRKLLKPEEVTALSDRLAITFTPGIPPLCTRLVRHYEENFKNQIGIGPVRAVFDSICLFVTVAVLAALGTAVLINPGF